MVQVAHKAILLVDDERGAEHLIWPWLVNRIAR